MMLVIIFHLSKSVVKTSFRYVTNQCENAESRLKSYVRGSHGKHGIRESTEKLSTAKARSPPRKSIKHKEESTQCEKGFKP
jgi:hypothetical protein